MKELLLEIGTEEIPSGYIIPAVAALRDAIIERLERFGLPFEDPKTYATPRRLAFTARNIPGQQPKRRTKVFGPPKKAAYAGDGSLTKAAIGFAKSKGVGVSGIKVGQTERGEYVYVEIDEGGHDTAGLLAETLPGIITGLPFPKSMRWGSGDLRFTRPIHWIVALFGGEVIDLALDGVAAGDATRGHRYLGSLSIAVTGGDDYRKRLEENFVIADIDLRKQAVLDGVRKAAKSHGAKLLEDDELVETVACLTEWPVALWGSFDEAYLQLPRELLIASMKNHQRMFAALGANGALTNGFVGVSNMKVEDDGVVVAGYQRVLAARLADAKFFFDEDLKTPLDAFAAKLDKVVYQKKLGMVGEKIERFTRLAARLAERIDPVLTRNVERTARLCKADLETLMVYEFPELQGIMGRVYARHAGEPEQVCEGIFEHYKPRWSGDDAPATDVGAIVGIADRIDTLAGCFGVGLIPTGTADPFALRRHALGLIQTVVDRRYEIDLSGLIESALAQLGSKIEEPAEKIKTRLLEFFAGRLKNLWTGQGTPYDVADAVIAAGFDNLAAADLRRHAMTELKKRDFFEPLAITFKRAGNITKGHEPSAVDETLFDSDAERKLCAAIRTIAGGVEELIESKRFLPALEKIAALRGEVDRFFDDVLVMAENDAVRENRLNLLGELTALFGRIADFSKIVA